MRRKLIGWVMLLSFEEDQQDGPEVVEILLRMRTKNPIEREGGGKRGGMMMKGETRMTPTHRVQREKRGHVELE